SAKLLLVADIVHAGGGGGGGAQDQSKTAFLIAGYARYKCPYFECGSNGALTAGSATERQLRSNHRRLIKLQEDQKLEEDNPLKLASVGNWKTQGTSLTPSAPQGAPAAAIIAEVMELALTPPPENPFAVDHSYFDTQTLEESVLASGAMVDFLRKVYLKESPYAEMGEFQFKRVVPIAFWSLCAFPFPAPSFPLNHPLPALRHKELDGIVGRVLVICTEYFTYTELTQGA
ncbi:MAG: hypothetical protein BJ554DRAFT_8455, partial [Olpidium bornovanus]